MFRSARPVQLQSSDRQTSSNTLSSLPLPTCELLKTLQRIYPPNVPTVWNTAIRRFEQCTHLKSIKGYIELYMKLQRHNDLQNFFSNFHRCNLFSNLFLVGTEVYWGPITSWIDEISPPHQGQTGRFFQIRVGSGSGIGKNFGFGSGSGSGSGIGTVFFINRVLSGNENIDRVFSGISISRLRFQN